MKGLIMWLDASPRRLMGLVALACMCLLGYGMYLQHVVGLEPCPMCIVQRYALSLVGLAALLGWAWPGRAAFLGTGSAVVLLAGFGAFVAARQSWLQWNPPTVAGCGRDFYGMIEAFPLQRAIPMIFRGGGDCSTIDWTFLGGSIANWSFVCFVLIATAVTAFMWRQRRGSGVRAS